MMANKEQANHRLRTSLCPSLVLLLLQLLVIRAYLFFVNSITVADEANTHYEAVINQLTHGHRFVQQELGVLPRYGCTSARETEMKPARRR